MTMRIASVEVVKMNLYRIVFANESDWQSKLVMAPFVTTKIFDAEKRREEFKRCIAKAAVEANRDMIVRELQAKNGKVAMDDLRSHQQWRASFSGLAEDALKAIGAMPEHPTFVGV